MHARMLNSIECRANTQQCRQREKRKVKIVSVEVNPINQLYNILAYKRISDSFGSRQHSCASVLLFISKNSSKKFHFRTSIFVSFKNSFCFFNENGADFTLI